jgi:hypothetical protein
MPHAEGETITPRELAARLKLKPGMVRNCPGKLGQADGVYRRGSKCTRASITESSARASGRASAGANSEHGGAGLFRDRRVKSSKWKFRIYAALKVCYLESKSPAQCAGLPAHRRVIMKIAISSALCAMMIMGLALLPRSKGFAPSHWTGLSIANAEDGPESQSYGAEDRQRENQQYGPSVDPYKNLQDYQNQHGGAPTAPPLIDPKTTDARGADIDVDEAYLNFLDAQESGDQRKIHAAYDRYIAAKAKKEQLQRGAAP